MFPRALGESGNNAAPAGRGGAVGRRRGPTPTPRRPRARAAIATPAALLAVAVGVAACGGGQRQDAAEPAGDFPVRVTAAEFPARQQLAQTSDLQLAIENVGKRTLPNLAVTIFTGGRKGIATSTGSGQSSFNVPIAGQDVANPYRPVWILENGYPKLLEPGVTKQNLDRAPPAGAAAAQTDTFQFGAVKPGDAKDAVWRLTAVRAGTYALHYVVAAGLEGKAKAVSRSGGAVKGDFAVEISSKPPQTCVTGSGQVTTNCGP